MGECSNSSSFICITYPEKANINWYTFLSSHKSSDRCLKFLYSAMQAMIEKKNKSEKHVHSLYLSLCNGRFQCGVCVMHKKHMASCQIYGLLELGLTRTSS